MAIQLSTVVRNALLDSTEATIGASAKLRWLTGAIPANCAAAQSGTLIAEMPLPADWMATAASGSKALLGTWTVAAVAAGTIGYYRIVDNSGATCHIQGTVTATGGGGDMTVDNIVVAISQTCTVNTFNLNAGNA